MCPGGIQEKAGNRKKPWGTGQAVLCCRDVVAEPFLVINSDDYYGKEAYREAYACLTREKEEKGISGDGKLDLCMVRLCAGKYFKRERRRDPGGGHADVTPEGFLLQDITETRHIVKTEEGAAVETDERPAAGGMPKPSGLHEHVGADPGDLSYPGSGI